MLVAIYGTLKVGHFNYEEHLKGEMPVTACFVALPFEMYAGDAYPMLVPSENGERHPIWVEVFDVDDEKLRELDELEAPYGYWRESVFIDQVGEEVAIYLHPAPAPEGFVRVASGKWG
jgi:gamma-glutamylcyclotransferase (GGCT)/AIG2-like uncharacterized protein YtfP